MVKMAWTSVLAIFIVSIISCNSTNQQEAPTEISFRYEGDKPVAVLIPAAFFPVNPIDINQLTFVVKSGSNQPILGEIDVLESVVMFRPAIPFRTRLSYEVRYRDIKIKEFIAEDDSPETIPELKNIYPTTDTVPENLLKIHLEFSEQMSELHSANYVNLLNANGDTLDHIFLKLDPELWNYDQTMLTLWLEPGRIKKSLLPNVLDGIPIEQGNTYTIAISDQWKSAKGIPLGKVVHKKIYVGRRDEVMPSVDLWEVSTPEGPNVPLIISFGEVLDYTSMLGSFSVVGSDGKVVPGSFQVQDGETGIVFIPDAIWLSGQYEIKIAGSVEDLAANNLNRLFDRDLMKDSSETVAEEKGIFFNVNLENPPQ